MEDRMRPSPSSIFHLRLSILSSNPEFLFLHKTAIGKDAPKGYAMIAVGTRKLP